MKKKYLVRNATFTPNENDKIIYEIPFMCCAKNTKECPIEKNPILDDYILMGNNDKPEKDCLDAEYCISIAKQLADVKIMAPIELAYSAHTDTFRSSEEAYRVCVAQKLNSVNKVKCAVKVNLIVKP